ncbi:hypothetical protein BGW39_004767 [Mortierella sp. 14UC]|nr:hypothetical protein BGW39_004767 [Mortierella sp. 14UC]
MALDNDESTPQGQTQAQTETETQAQPTETEPGTETGPIEATILQTGQRNNAPTTPSGGTSTQESKPKVYLTGTEGLVWDIQDVRKLRQDHRIVGSLAGSLPRSPMQNIFQGLPLRLFPEEVSVLLHHGIIDLIVDNTRQQPPPQQQQQEQQDSKLDASSSTSTPLTDRALVFEHLWKDHQFFIAPGMKFGGDYLLYRNDPLVCHASLVASVKEPDEETSLSLLDLASSARLVSTVQKQHLLCSILPFRDDTATTATAATEVTTDTPTASGPNHRVVTFAVEWAGF